MIKYQQICGTRGFAAIVLGCDSINPKNMSKSILYTRVSTLDQRTDRQRVTENDFSLVVEDYCSGSIPIFDRPEGSKLKKMIDRNLVSSISVWQIDRCGRDLRDIINFIHYATERRIPVNFLSQGLTTLDKDGRENPIAKMIIAILGVVSEMTRTQILENQRQGIELAKLDPNKYMGRKPGSVEDPVKFLSKKRNRQALDLLKNGYKNIEVSKILGIHPNTVTKIKRHLR